MVPFHSSLLIDAIPHIDMNLEACAPLIAGMGMLNWLQQCTRPNLATILHSIISHALS
jgi:hypothetical protein